MFVCSFCFVLGVFVVVTTLAALPSQDYHKCITGGGICACGRT